jgi:TonB family protein
MSRLHTLSLGLLLFSAACARQPVAEAAPASVPEPPAAGAPGGLLVRYALLVGGRGAGTAPAAAEVLSRDELTKTLLDWDTDTDSSEVKRLFALHHLGEVARQAYELPAGGGHARGFYNYGGAVYELGLEARPRAGDTILFKAEIRRDRETLSSPEVIARLGERAILSTENGGDAPFLFFVVEATPAPYAGGAPAAAGEVRPGADGVYKVDGDRIRPPKNIHRVDPKYTDAARKARVTGQVVLECIVDEQGRIADVKVVRGLPEGLDQAAIDAIRQWRFEPSRLDGQPVKVRFTLTINFKLDDGEKPA